MVRRLEWSSALQNQLKTAMGDDAGQVKKDIESGQLLALSWGGELFTVTETQGKTLVLCCVAGRNVTHYLKHIYHWARCAGCESIRFHSKRPGFARIGKQYEFKPVDTDSAGQTVYQCEVY